MLDLTRLRDAIRHEGGFSRRLLLAYGAARAAIPTLGQCAEAQAKGKINFQSYPFSLGVASGEPTDDGVVIWTRLAPKPLQEDGAGGMPRQDVDVDWQVATDEKMTKVIKSGTATATRRLGHSVHVELKGLPAGAWYWYRFRCGTEESPIGRTRTTPAANDKPGRLRGRPQGRAADCGHGACRHVDLQQGQRRRRAQRQAESVAGRESLPEVSRRSPGLRPLHGHAQGMAQRVSGRTRFQSEYTLSISGWSMSSPTITTSPFGRR